MKKLICFTISFFVVTASTFSVYAADFNDLKSTNWAYEAISAMSSKAVIAGYPDGSFKPNNTVTYGEFIKMALLASTGKDVGNSASGNWAEGYYKEALNLGYFTEYDIKKSALNREITRAHMALIISSILGAVEIKDYDEIQKGITDITYKTLYEYDITKSYATGILTGYEDKTFKPDKTLSRAEAATVIYRLVDESKRVLPNSEKQTGNIKPINEVIKNINSYYTENGSFDNLLARTETYSFVDGTKYYLKLANNETTKWFIVPASVSDDFCMVYFMNDGIIIESLRVIGVGDGSLYYLYNSDITAVDYIVSVGINKNALIISNPFKK